MGFVLLLAVTGNVDAWTEDEVSDFERANRNYRESQYEEAISIYEKLAEKYPKASALFYNLGNSYYRVKKLGAAILAYERALVLEPRNSDVRHNLDYSRGLLEYRIKDKRNWYLRMGDKTLRHVTEREVHSLGLLVYFLFIGSCVFVLFFRRGLPWGWVRKSLLLLTVLFSVVAVVKNMQVRVIRDAIVMTPKAEARYGPSDSDQVAFRLGEGLKVSVVDHRESWSRILLVSGESGWIRKDQIVEVQL